MTEAQIKLHKLTCEKKSISTQTGNSVEFCVQLNENKRARLYYSDSYKDYVLAFNINKSKSFILDRHMWKKLRNHIQKIENELGN
jgi:hypothetical protein